MTPTSEPATPAGRVQSVDRAVRLLDEVAAAANGATVAELASACGINRATAWRLLSTLEAHALVDRDPGTNRYVVGLGVLRLSGGARHEGLRRRSQPILERVTERTGETAALAIPGSRGLTYVAEAAPASVLSVNWLGQDVPLHATSTGKALLAWLPQSDALSLLELPLQEFTDHTTTDLDVLLTELAGTRQRGFAQCAGELEATLYGVSAPVLHPGTGQGRPLAILSIWGPVDRVPTRRFDELGEAARQAALEVAAVVAPPTS